MKRRFLLPIVALLLMSSCMRPNKEPGLSVEGKAMDTLSQTMSTSPHCVLQ